MKVLFSLLISFCTLLAIKVIDEQNKLLRSDIICEGDNEKPDCRLFFPSFFNQLSFKSFKLRPRLTDTKEDEITHQAIFKGFKLRFSKLVSFAVDDDFTKFEYKVCKPRGEETYAESKKFKLEITELIQTDQDEEEGRNLTEDDKEVHICLTERFSIDYRLLLSRKCGQKKSQCSTKYDFSPNQERTLEIVNASIYVGREVFELKVHNSCEKTIRI